MVKILFEELLKQLCLAAIRSFWVCSSSTAALIYSGDESVLHFIYKQVLFLS
jgi:hypothetical protein